MSNPWEKVANPADSEKKVSKQNLSLQQKALVVGMLHEKQDSTTNFKEKNGIRYHQNETREGDYESLVEKFKNNPKDCLAFGRENLIAIMADQRMNPDEKECRVKRYIDAYFDLIIKLDRSVFPPSDEVKNSVPEYIPDGLVDMGSDKEIDYLQRRGREKIRVDKEKIFEQSKKLFYDIFSKDLSGLDNSKLKNYFILKIAQFIHQEMPYDYKNTDPFQNEKKTVSLSNAFGEKAVCRHHALYAQVLMQSFGLTSRLLKCNMNFGDNRGSMAHGANLVRNNNAWYLLDVTNPDLKKDNTDPKGTRMIYEVFLKKLKESRIDLNKEKYNWEFKRNDGRIYKYETRNNMYYYIKDAQSLKK